MSGCAHCVWDVYADDLASWRARHRESAPAEEAQPDLGSASRAAFEALERSLNGS